MFVMNRWHLTAILILIFGSVWIWLSRVPVDAQVANRSAQPAIGYPAPAFTLTSLQEQPFAFEQGQGKAMVLNFWATWCNPCQRELPTLQAAAERYADVVKIVGIDQGEDRATVQEYVKARGLTFDILLDTDLTVGQKFNIKGMPTTFFVDSDGVIRYLWIGEMNSITLAEGIARITR
jgi:thiol-disulfide isomerase/thioredoxin